MLNSFWRHCRVTAIKSKVYPKNSLSTLSRMAGLHFKFAASSVLYANEKNQNIHYDPDNLSGLSRARLRVFPTTFLEIAVYKSVTIQMTSACGARLLSGWSSELPLAAFGLVMITIQSYNNYDMMPTRRQLCKPW